MTKIVFAWVLTIAATVGSGVVAQQVGLEVTPMASACGNASGGGC